ncbi:hypothetical protein Tco_0849462 [Tanacetum coccineum]
MARMDAITMKIDALYKEFQSRSKQSNPDHNDDEKPMSREEEANFMQTFCRARFYNEYRDRDSNRDNWRSSGRNDYNRDNFQSHYDDKPDLQKQLSDSIKAQHSTNSFLNSKKNTDKQSSRPSGFLPSNTQLNPKGSSSKPYQPPQARNKHVNAIFTRSSKSYDPPVNPNDQQNDSKAPINFDSDDEDEEPTPQSKTQKPKPVKETPIPKPYKPKIPYPQRLRKEKIEAQYGKFLDMILAVQINVPLIDVLARMPNYGKFLKELVSNKHKIEQISAAFLSNESSVPCNFNKTFSCNALADLGASINLMPYSLYANIDVIDEILEEDYDSLLEEGTTILHSIEGTILEEKLVAEFDEFMAMTVDENSESESDTEEPPFEKITFNTDYKIKTSLEEPLSDFELRPLPDNLEYAFLEEPSFLLVIISSQLSKQNKNKLVFVLKRHKQAFA